MADEPTTKKSAQRDAKDAEDDFLATSADAQHSTYREATPDELDNHDGNPPPGPHTIQERGVPSESGEPKK